MSASATKQGRPGAARATAAVTGVDAPATGIDKGYSVTTQVEADTHVITQRVNFNNRLCTLLYITATDAAGNPSESTSEVYVAYAGPPDAPGGRGRAKRPTHLPVKST